MNVRGLKILVVVLLVACACCWTLSIVSHAFLTTAPLPWDEAYLMALPTRVAHAWSGGGPFEAIAAYFGTSSFKAPLSSLGTHDRRAQCSVSSSVSDCVRSSASS
ncbi:MAG: hypothetical protein KDC95_03650 [Planctomycetes bacterium]|nr:hypothetical protein [Planctomycetota bacterium]